MLLEGPFTKLKPEKCEQCTDGVITLELCSHCGLEEIDHDGADHSFDYSGDVLEDDCHVCLPVKFSTVGLTYVAVGFGDRAVLLDTDCSALLHDLNEIGPYLDELGLETPEGFDPGIWKGVVKLWMSVSWEGEHDHGYSVVNDWEEVHSYPEPDCKGAGQGTLCEGMKKERNEAGTIWACDAHAAHVS